MKYIYSLLVLLIVINNSLSNEPVQSREHAEYLRKMARLNEQRAYQESINNNNRLRNIERQIIYDRLGIDINIVSGIN